MVLKCFHHQKILPDNYFDLIISNNAPEHCDNPLLELKELHRSLKKGSKICIAVPCDNIKNKYLKEDPHKHLYSWSPSNLEISYLLLASKLLRVDLFCINGFRTDIFKKFMSWNLFHFLCKIWSRIG